MGKNGGFKFRSVVWVVLISFTIGQIGLLSSSPVVITEEKLAPLQQLSKTAGSKETSAVPERSKGGLRGGAVSAIAAAALLWLGATPSLSQEAGAETVAPEAAEGAASLAASETPLEELVQKIGEGSIDAVFTLDDVIQGDWLIQIPNSLYSVDLTSILLQFEKGDSRAFQALEILFDRGHTGVYDKIRGASIAYWKSRTEAEQGYSEELEILIRFYERYDHSDISLAFLMDRLKRAAEEGDMRAITHLARFTGSDSETDKEEANKILSTLAVGNLFEKLKTDEVEFRWALSLFRNAENPEAVRFLEEWDPQEFIEGTEQGMIDKARWLLFLASHGNATAAFAIRELNTEKLVQQVKETDSSLQVLFNLEIWGNRAVREVMRNWDVTPFVKEAEEGREYYLRKLYSLGNSKAEEAMKTLDLSVFVEKVQGEEVSVRGVSDLFNFAEAGNPSAVKALSELDCQRLLKGEEERENNVELLLKLVKFGNQSAGEIAQQLDVQHFLNRANEGDAKALYDLEQLKKAGYDKAGRALGEADPRIFLERAIQGDSPALWVLLDYVSHNQRFQEALEKFNLEKVKSGDVNTMELLLIGIENKPTVRKAMKEINAQVFIDQLQQVPETPDFSWKISKIQGILRDLLSIGNETPILGLTALAQGGSLRAIEALAKSYFYQGEMPFKQKIEEILHDLKLHPSITEEAGKDKKEAQEILARLASLGNPQAIALCCKLAREGNTKIILVVREYAFQQKYLSEETRIMSQVPIPPLIKKGLEGDGEAVEILWILTYYQSNHETAKQALRELDPIALKKKAEEGDIAAARAIRFLVDSDNTLAKEVASNLDLTRLTELSKESSKAAELLIWFAFQGNRRGMKILEELVRNGEESLVFDLASQASSRVRGLRTAHLTDHISDEELGVRLTTETCGDNPLLLYIYFNSEENFGDLAKKIFGRLQKIAKDRRIEVSTLLHQMDPHQLFYKEFILQAANFSLLDDLLTTPQALKNVMDGLFKDLSIEKLRSYSTRLALFIEAVTVDKSFSHQEVFQKYLLDLYHQSSGVHQKLIGILLKIYHDQLNYLNPADLPLKIEIPWSKDEISYERLLNKNGELVVHIIFGDGDAVRDHFDETALFFQQKGYVRVGGDGRRLTLKQGKVELVLIKGEDGSYDINEGWSQAGIVISRSHAGGEREVFKNGIDVSKSQGKIAVMSACRSASKIGEVFIESPGTFWVGINATAYGARTNNFTYYLLEGLERRMPALGQIKKFAEQKLAAAGQKWTAEYVMPGDRAYTVTVALEALFQGAMEVSLNQAQTILQLQQENRQQQESPTGSYREWTLALLTFPDQRQFLTLIRNTGSSVPDAGRVQIESSL